MSTGTNWRQYAACIGIDPRAFFPVGYHARAQVNAARRVCATCPVRQQCAAFAIEVGEHNGIWGGMSQQELRQKRRRFRARTDTTSPKPPAKKREPAKCGTRAGYQKHLREKTEICAPCRQANTDADNRLRRTGTTKASA
ncbi:WhiB family transcriptional regulator [Streptomyces purpurascens]|uniref:WhiB family transcriptional regulator n=1 Tax=Streptomyces purpurascens TaxID=1924 RepID=UPI00167465FE|nr:WhiB family transcriptional regulator [Streptomyces purpurascens]MCE7049516.1 WhiB family transcriptional regulator [Streptomyces purpurascens]GHA22253.1 hypothetical protein GCM10010303_35950 [Streptomyces purpurascens]